MARYVVEVRTDRSPQAAFAYLAHLTNFAEWDPGVVAATQVTGQGPGPGAEYDVVVKGWLGRNLTLRYRTTAYEAPVSVRVVARSRMLTSDDTITVRPSGNGSIVTYDARLELAGPLALADALLRPTFRRIGDRAADGLVAVLSGERVGAALVRR